MFSSQSCPTSSGRNGLCARLFPLSESTACLWARLARYGWSNLRHAGCPCRARGLRRPVAGLAERCGSHAQPRPCAEGGGYRPALLEGSRPGGLSGMHLRKKISLPLQQTLASQVTSAAGLSKGAFLSDLWHVNRPTCQCDISCLCRILSSVESSSLHVCPVSRAAARKAGPLPLQLTEASPVPLSTAMTKA